MANIFERRNKDGVITSYTIRVFRGRDSNGKQLKPFTESFPVEPTWSEKTARKKAEAYASVLEKRIQDGIIASDSRVKFQEYCEYFLHLRETTGKCKASTLQRYRELAKRIYPAIGHLQVKEIRTMHLNAFYQDLQENDSIITSRKAKAKTNLKDIIKKKHITMESIASSQHLAINTVYQAFKGEKVAESTAKSIAFALGKKFDSIFELTEKKPLSAKTIIEHHRLISVVFELAKKEGIVTINPASVAELPKITKKEVNYFQPEEIRSICNALDMEDIKWKTLVHLLLITGARRGEILGLKWDDIDEKNCTIYIHRAIYYTPQKGIYEDSVKSDKSNRKISVPSETIALMKEYRRSQAEQRLFLGEQYANNENYIFTQKYGSPMNPDSVNDWLNKFSKRNGFRHINPHAFRHSMASLLYFNNIDSVSISNRLGHAQVSTTANIYSHIIAEADKRNADILSTEIFRKVSEA